MNIKEDKHMFFELHAHTTRYSSCSRMTPEEYIEAARKKSLSGICLTEHDNFWDEEEYKQFCEKAEGLIVINGNEKRCWDGDRIQGDFLVFGCKEDFGKITIDQLIKIVHRKGGIVIAAHPFREMLGVSEKLIYSLDLDAIEMYSSNQEPWQTKLAITVANKMKLPIIGASDAHIPELVGYSVTEFKIPVKNEQDFIKAIKNRQFVALPHGGKIETK